ncbi:STT3 domain-containing protein [Haloarcula amylovorans]|uniref:STT3 domain-containing protein n=1 Tax=Haloarcula amylovorans TaxID=2562280 RepID=UPI001075DCC3|nr:STT3 domain-containing protein [Halomicroarcula amylolytica]
MDEQVRVETRELLDERPALRDDLHAILDRDEAGPWSFQDVPVDSGAFGEIVAAGLVRETDDGYRLRDREAVAQALGEETTADMPTDDGSSTGTTDTNRSPSLPAFEWSLDRRRAGTLAGALLFVVLVRTALIYPSVFREGTVVLAGNDPYMYHEAVEMLLADGPPAFSISGLGDLSVEFLATEMRTHDTLLIVGLWWASAALGGQEAVGTVVAWYPVLAALVSAVAVYAMTFRVTDDVRCAIASVLLLAITPAHAYRTALGFGDHHALDFALLSLTALAVLVVSRERLDADGSSLGLSPAGWAAVVGGGVAIAAQTAAWRGGPLLLLPIAVYAVVRTYLDVRAGDSPVRTVIPLLALLAVGAVLSLGLHVGFGWLQSYRALAPALLFGGVVSVVAIAALVGRFDLPAWSVFVGDAALGVVGFVLAPLLVPSVASAVTEFGAYLETYGQTSIAETQSLFSGGMGSIVAPIFLFGLLFFLAVPYLAWVTWRQVYDGGHPDWLVLSAYAWWFLLLAMVQNRFTGELSPFLAVFAGVAFVHLAAWVDIVRPPSLTSAVEAPNPELTDRTVTDGGIRRLELPDRRTVGYLFVLFLLVGGLGVVQSSVKMEQIAVDDVDYQTGTWLGEYADGQGVAYPENYVLSRWGNNRADNYLVNGETESYGYARENYGDFVRSTDGSGWYSQFREDDVGYVLTRASAAAPESSVHTQLHEHYGSRTGSQAALEHYRAIYATGSGERVVSAVVPGATVTGSATPGSTVTAETTVTLPPANTSFTYTQRVAVAENGTYRFTTPYPGEYSIGNRTVEVSENAVQNGETVGS